MARLREQEETSKTLKRQIRMQQETQHINDVQRKGTVILQAIGFSWLHSADEEDARLKALENEYTQKEKEMEKEMRRYREQMELEQKRLAEQERLKVEEERQKIELERKKIEQVCIIHHLEINNLYKEKSFQWKNHYKNRNKAHLNYKVISRSPLGHF